MKKPVTYCNSQDDRFAGSAALLVAVTFTSVSLLSLSVGYPARLGSILLLVVSFIVTGLSYTYLTHITGRLRISERGIDYLPEQGKNLVLLEGSGKNQSAARVAIPVRSGRQESAQLHLWTGKTAHTDQAIFTVHAEMRCAAGDVARD